MEPPIAQSPTPCSQQADSSLRFTSVEAQPKVGSDRKPHSSPLSSETVGYKPHASVEPSLDNQEPLLHVTNIHAMVTRSKADVFKPKAMSVEAVEPSIMEKAFSHSEWRATA
ncbi:protein NRT1/PTR FAMILY 6.2-like [Gossypium australe]|uniref:Protein NRT1/PTR FAMILY 6.2-like n=1 Tax=Gossypium australe TaxID=47621 RepID=A0A5B6W5I3_9ROSI|nr:protein NRT1/PTR FAMILY 6.2-like [Gossypium australe]